MNTITLCPYELLDTLGNVRQVIEIPVIHFSSLSNGNGDAEIKEDYLVPTWKNYQEISFNLAFNLLEAGIKPVEMITLANGGFIGAKFVQDRMKYKGKVLTIGIEGYGEDNRALPQPILKNGLSPDLKIKGDVLIIDDIYDKGTAKKVAHEEVLKKNPTKIHFGFVFMRKEPHMPEEYAGLVIGEEWVLFPSDAIENEDNLRSIWTKAVVPTKVQDLRVSIICSQDLKERQLLVHELNELSTSFGQQTIAQM